MYDTVIIGGGPAGLSAALMLGRCRRRVVVCDAGAPRNARSRELHGFLTRDGTVPLEFLRIGREEIRGYDVDVREVTVTGIRPRQDGFDVTTAEGQGFQARTILIASGVRDDLPRIPGLDECFGITVHHCPYCDGWEARDKALAIIGDGRRGAALALALKTWSARVVLCSNGAHRLPPSERSRLSEHGITLNATRVVAVEHAEGLVHHLCLANGAHLACDAVFVATGQRQQCGLARQLGCALTRKGTVKTDHLGQTGVPGVYVAGDASRDVQFAVVAAAEGAKAAVAINKALQQRDGLSMPPP